MSLWQDDEYTDDESAKAARVQERDAFFNVEDTTDRSEHSWYEYRRQAFYGFAYDPEHHLEPYVTYMPATMEVQEVHEVIKVPKFIAFSRKNQAAKDALAEDELNDEQEEGEEDEDDDVDSYSWFGATKPNHRRQHAASGNAKPVRGFDKDSGAVYIQKLYRARLAKKATRKALCKTWCKKADTTPGIFYYENVHTGETRWVPPRLMQRLFPRLRW